MSSSAQVNGNDFELSPMRVTYDGIDLGGTKGGVAISVKEDWAELGADQFGKTPIDHRKSGQAYKIKFELCEINKKSNWKVALPHAKLITSGPNQALYVDAAIGASLLAVSKKLKLHPLSKDDSDLSGDYTFWKCASMSAVEIKYSSSDQSVLSVEMVVYPDATAFPARFFIHGDETIGLVAATVSAAVAAAGNIGNGTVGSLTAGAQALTETITLTNIDGGSGFSVVGSVSGSIGVAKAGIAFTSSRVNFTIAQGSTPFATNDDFTIASTGPNYN